MAARANKGDSAAVSKAERRATLTAYLSQHPGEHSVAQIAEAHGISMSAAGQNLANMAKNKLIKVRKEGTTKLYSAKRNGELVLGEEEALDRPKRGYTRRQKTSGVQEVNIVINLKLIITVEEAT